MRNACMTVLLVFGFLLIGGTNAQTSESNTNVLEKAISLIPSDPHAADTLLAGIPEPAAIGWRMYIIAVSRSGNHDAYAELAREYASCFMEEIPVEAELNVENALEYVMYAYLKDERDKGRSCIPVWLFKKHPKAAMEASWTGSYGGFNSLFIRDSYCPQAGPSPCTIPEYAALRKLLYDMDGGHVPPCRGSIEYAHGSARWKWEYMLGVDIEFLTLFRQCAAPTRLEEFLALWGNKGVWEQAKVRAYHVQRAKSVTALKAWLMKHKSFSADKAATYAAMIADELTSRIVGRFPMDLLNETRTSWYRFATAPSPETVSPDGLKSVLPKKQMTLNYMLHVCVLNHQPVETIRKLRAAGATLENDAENETILAIGDPDYLKQILALGVPVDHANRFGKTALSYAVQLGYKDSAEVLLAHGADINKATAHLEGSCDGGWEKRNPFWYPGCYMVEGGKTPLMYACGQSSLAMVKLLLKHGAQFSGQKRGLWEQLLEQNEIMTPEEKSEALMLLPVQ